MSEVLSPRFQVFRRAEPDAPMYAFIVWIGQQRRRFHESQRAVRGHGWHDTHDCLDCLEANASGEFDAWLEAQA